MSYDIKLYAHGVPKGQSTWGVESFDSNYIESFYGRKSNVTAQMIVEVRQFGTSTNCYYTYLRTGNVCDNSGRAGSYLALTLRINYYYADIQNIYNLLTAAYDKFIVGTIVEVKGGVAKYLITDFVQANTVLNALQQEITRYMMQFSSDSDFVPLGGFKANGQNESEVVNILDCDVTAITNIIKKNSSVSVSHLYQSIRERQFYQKMTAEVNAANTQAQQQISEVKRNAQRDIDAVRTQAKQDIATAQREKDASIKAIRDEYKEADKTISSLRQDIENDKKEIERLNGIIKDLKRKLQEAEEYKKKYDAIKKEHENKDDLYNKVCQEFSKLEGIKALIYGKASKPDSSEDGKTQPKEEERFSLGNFIRKIHPFSDLFIMLVLLVIIGITLPKSCENNKSVSYAEMLPPDDNSKSAPDKYEQPDGDTVKEPEVVTVFSQEQETQPSLKERFPQAKIDIANISPQNPMRYGYNVSLQNVDVDLEGKWVSNDFTIDNNRIMPKKSGQCAISYIVNGDTLVTRIITVK